MEIRFIVLNGLGERSAPNSYSKVMKYLSSDNIEDKLCALIQKKSRSNYKIRPVCLSYCIYCCFFTLESKFSGNTGIAPCCVQTKAETSTAI